MSYSNFCVFTDEEVLKESGPCGVACYPLSLFLLCVGRGEQQQSTSRVEMQVRGTGLLRNDSGLR